MRKILGLLVLISGITFGQEMDTVVVDTTKNIKITFLNDSIDRKRAPLHLTTLGTMTINNISNVPRYLKTNRAAKTRPFIHKSFPPKNLLKKIPKVARVG